MSGVLRSRRHLSFTGLGHNIGRMGSDYDPEREAEEAMRLALAAAGLERQRWISLAMAWQELARMRTASTSGGTKKVA
jgi:hypothetical protein